MSIYLIKVKRMNLTNKIYNEVFGYLEMNGYINALKKSLKISENERYAKLTIEKNGLAVLDAVHCVFDKKRSMIFLREIDKLVQEDDVVVEAGIGVGILSFMAAAKGAEVYGVEYNSETLKLANRIKEFLHKKGIINFNKINFKFGDATKYKPPRNPDIIICENIYNGMFYEKQVQIMNHLRSYLKKNGHVIPNQLNSSLILCESSFSYTPKDKEGFSPFERNFSIKKELGRVISYDILKFNQKNKNALNKSLKIVAINTGTINTLVFYSDIFMPSGKVIGRNETTFLSEDFVLAINPSIPVKKGNFIEAELSFPYGEKPENSLINITNSSFK